MFLLYSYSPSAIEQYYFLPSLIAMTQGELLDNITRLVILSSPGQISGELLLTPGDRVRKNLPIIHELL